MHHCHCSSLFRILIEEHFPSLVVWYRTDPVHSQLFSSLNMSYYSSQVILAVNLSCAQHTLLNSHTHILKLDTRRKQVHRDNEGWGWWHLFVLVMPNSCLHALQSPIRISSAKHHPKRDTESVTIALFAHRNYVFMLCLSIELDTDISVFNVLLSGGFDQTLYLSFFHFACMNLSVPNRCPQKRWLSLLSVFCHPVRILRNLQTVKTTTCSELCHFEKIKPEL